jgi:hypothetical protein
MNGYIIVICIMLIMFAGLAIIIVQADADERRFLAEHEDDDLLVPVDATGEPADQHQIESDSPELDQKLTVPTLSSHHEGSGEDATAH